MSEFSARDMLITLGAMGGLTLAGIGVLLTMNVGNWAAASVMAIGIVGMLLGWLLLSVPNPRRTHLRNRRQVGRPRALAV